MNRNPMSLESLISTLPKLILARRLTGTVDGRPVVISADDAGVTIDLSSLRSAAAVGRLDRRGFRSPTTETGVLSTLPKSSADDECHGVYGVRRWAEASAPCKRPGDRIVNAVSPFDNRQKRSRPEFPLTACHSLSRA